MIGITGYMSGGKTYYAVEHMLGAMYQRHRVVTNIQLCCQAVTTYLEIPCIWWKQLYYYLEERPNGYHHLAINAYDEWPHGSLRGSSDYERNLVYVYLDEVSSLFDSMVHASDSSVQKVATWARHTEKKGIKIFLIMQFASELHKRLRVHITEYVACTNSSTVNIPLIGCKLPWFLRGLTIRSRYLSDGETQIGQAKWYTIRPIIYNCYRTAQIVVGSGDLAPFVPPIIDTTSREERHATRLVVFVAFLYLFSFVVYCFIFIRVYYV